MAYFVWILSAVLCVHLANSYILLTANLEDVQAIAKQIASSPVVDQLHRIWRRATSQFGQQIARARAQRKSRSRHTPFMGESNLGEQLSLAKNGEIMDDASDRDYKADRRRRSQNDEDIIALGKNASIYLKSIRKIFDN